MADNILLSADARYKVYVPNMMTSKTVTRIIRDVMNFLVRAENTISVDERIKSWKELDQLYKIIEWHYLCSKRKGEKTHLRIIQRILNFEMRDPNSGGRNI